MAAPYRFSLLLLLTLMACQAGPDREKEKAPASPPAGETYPSLPQERAQYLWDNCDYIDIIFYQLDFTMSLDQQGSIRKALQHFSREPATISPGCQPAGRIFYQSQGDILAEADLYFDPQCQMFLFYEDGRKAYTNGMTPAGLEFFQNVFTQIQQN